jgi:hypothetical protein
MIYIYIYIYFFFDEWEIKKQNKRYMQEASS